MRLKVGGLVPGLFYDFEAATVSGPNESTASTITNQLAPGDTTPPSAAGTPSLSDQKLTTATFIWTPSASITVRGYNWDLRTGSNGSGAVVKSGYVEGATLTLDAASVGYSSARHFRVQPVAFTPGLVGSFTASASVTFAPTVTPDIGDLTLSLQKYIDSSISTIKIAAGAITQSRWRRSSTT